MTDRALAFVLVLLLPTCLTVLGAAPLLAQTSGPEPAGDNPAAQASLAQSSTPTLFSGDLLEISIWREPELSGRFPVDEEGIVTLPLLGPVPVLGVPVPELRRHLLAEYGRDLRNPSITITPLRRIHVLGEVTQPGLFPVDLTVSLAGAVAMAGGATPVGDLEKIRIVRDGVVILEGAVANEDLTSIDVRSGDQIIVERRGWFERHSAFLVSTVIGAAGIMVSILR